MTRDIERENALWEIEESRLESRIERLSIENARLRKALEEIERRGQRGVNYTIESVYVGTAGHLRRYKVLDANGKYVPGGLFKTLAEAEAYGETHA